MDPGLARGMLDTFPQAIHDLRSHVDDRLQVVVSRGEVITFRLVGIVPEIAKNGAHIHSVRLEPHNIVQPRQWHGQFTVIGGEVDGAAVAERPQVDTVQRPNAALPLGEVDGDVHGVSSRVERQDGHHQGRVLHAAILLPSPQPGQPDLGSRVDASSRNCYSPAQFAATPWLSLYARALIQSDAGHRFHRGCPAQTGRRL